MIQGLFERKISHHEMFIPENAESALEIKSEALVRTFVEDILAEGALDERFNSLLKSSDGNSEPSGIDYLSNCYIFTFQKKNVLFTGILVNVLDEHQFEKAMDSSPESGFGHYIKNGVGLMLFQSRTLTKIPVNKTFFFWKVKM